MMMMHWCGCLQVNVFVMSMVLWLDVIVLLSCFLPVKPAVVALQRYQFSVRKVVKAFNMLALFDSRQSQIMFFRLDGGLILIGLVLMAASCFGGRRRIVRMVMMPSAIRLVGLMMMT
jgi:hypothetical protein